MFNNSLGPIVADPTTGEVFEGFMAGEPQTRCCSADFNNVYVSRSSDGGAHYTATLVYHAPAGTRVNNFWPATAVDPVTGEVLVTWTDQHGVFVANSTDHGEHWSAPTLVSSATTTVMPWIAARAGKVDVVYYGSAAASPDDPAGVWNTYDSQRIGGAWSVARVSNAPNRVGRVCLEGSGCVANQDRELLDLFEVAEDPATGKAAIIYTSSQLNTYTITGDPQAHELPEIVLAYER